MVTLVWANVATPDRPCTDAAPCGAHWLGFAESAPAVGLVCWLARLPELTLVTAPPLAVLVGWLELPGPGTTATVADVSVLVALVFCWAAAVERLTARRRQRRPAEHAARVRHPSPAPAVPLRRGRTPITAGLLLLGAAVFAVVQGVGGTVADRHHAHRAERITARVLGHGEESVRLRAGDGRLLTLSASSPGGYRRGSTVTVLEDGTWRRLLAEPYDASGRQLLGLATGLPGGSMLLTGLLARRRAAALRGVPVPVLRVLERADEPPRDRCVGACLNTAARRTAPWQASAGDPLEGIKAPSRTHT